MIFDTHAHYDDTAFDSDREELLSRMKAGGIGRIMNIGASMEGCEKSIALAEQYDFIYAAVGIHPDECADFDEAAVQKLRALAQHPKCAAIGEIGLDYHGFDIYPDKPPKQQQKDAFLRQLALAAELNKAVVVHSRNAAQDTLEIMQDAHDRLGIRRAIIHCFSYSKEAAEQYIRMGYMLGFGGSTTYEGQKKLTKVLSVTPADRIVLETDCPYLAPVPCRGERNSSLLLPCVRDRICEITGMAPGELEQITWENACRVYSVSGE